MGEVLPFIRSSYHSCPCLHLFSRSLERTSLDEPFYASLLVLGLYRFPAVLVIVNLIAYLPPPVLLRSSVVLPSLLPLF